MPDILRLKKSNCKNCYKCIRHCPVKAIRFSGSQAHIVENECILCGECFVVCPQNAKEVIDDTEKVKVLIDSGDPVYVSLAPSFIANYEGAGIESMRSALKKLGFYDVEETAIGATIVKKEYERILNEDKPEILISSCCASVNLLIQKHFPNELKYLADVLSPMQAHAMDIKRRDPSAKVVFIGPCVAKKDETNRDEYNDKIGVDEAKKSIVDASLTFEDLTLWLQRENIELEKVADKLDKTRTRIFPTAGGVMNSMDKNDEYTYFSVDGTQNCINVLHDIENGNIQKCFIEMSACPGSCVGGPVMESVYGKKIGAVTASVVDEERKYRTTPVRNYAAVAKYAGKTDFDTEEYKPVDISRTMKQIPKEARQPSESEIMATLRKMNKYKKEDELNCGCCGYETCRDKAVAIIQGKAEVSMCLPFLKEKAENFSDNIINNTPNGIIVLNEELEVQQINKAALTMMNLKRASDCLGEQVVRILDPTDFINVRNSYREIHGKNVYLAEYDKYVEETIIFDAEYHILIGILRDVTTEEVSRSQNNKLTLETIEVADKVVEKQMRIAQEIASLLGETTAETKVALTKLKESVKNE